MAFVDDFNRANGAIDNGWTDLVGGAIISSGYPTGSGTPFVIREIDGGEGMQTVTLDLKTLGNTGYTPRCVVKSDASGQNYYYATANLGPSLAYVYIYKVTAGVGAQIANGTYNSAPGLTPTLVLSYHSGALTATINGGGTATASDSAWAANTWQGMQNFPTAVQVETFTGDAAEDPTMTLLPALVSGFAGQVVLTATLHGTAWSTDPAVTVFTVDHGTVDDQVVVDSTHALIFWAFALSQYTEVTFTESEHGLTATVNSDPELPPDYGTGYDLTIPASKLLDRTGVFCDDGRILTTCDVVDSGPPVSITQALDAILEQLGGFDDQVGADIGAVSLPSEIKELAAKVGETGYWTTAEVIALLGGSPTVYSHADLKTAIDLIAPGDNQDVLDALAAYFGEDPPTIAQLGTMISDLATIAGYTLSDVKDWIDAIPVPDPVDLTPITDELDTLSDKIDALASQISALDFPAAPIWPGAEGVTLGEPVELEDQLILAGPMDGCLITVTTPPTRTGLRQVGGKLYDYGVGEVAFGNDLGYVEPWQYLGFRQALFTPKSMASADAAYFRVLAGASGTVQTFVRS